MCFDDTNYIDCKSVAKCLSSRVIFAGIDFLFVQVGSCADLCFVSVMPVPVLSVFCYWTFSTVNIEFVLCVK